MFGMLKKAQLGDLPGRWMRVNDSFAGCIIEITHGASKLQGKLVVCPGTMQSYGWQVGQLKWRNIVHTKRNRFILEDLYLTYDKNTQSLINSTYRATEFKLADADTIHISEGHTRQVWQRVSR